MGTGRQKLYAVIMAGGSGTRLWPESRRRWPKQLLSLAGEESLLQATVTRVLPLVPPEQIVVATTAELAPAIAEQVPFLPRDALLIEPAPRNTAPCLGLAAARILRQDPDALMLVLPADHVIKPPEAFCEDVAQAVALLEEDPTRLVTFGIRPTYPSPSFGYIERGEPIASGGRRDKTSETSSVVPPTRAYRAQHFWEKPSREKAQEYLARGTFFWNAGIFLWKAATLWKALETHEPEVFCPLARIVAAADSPRFAEILAAEFPQIKKISIDYAVMERADNVVVIEASFQWDDVGSWRALERLVAADPAGNIADASRVLFLDSRGTIVHCRESQHLVAVLGVDDLVIIATPDVTLVARKDREEDVRQILDELERRGWQEYL